MLANKEEQELSGPTSRDAILSLRYPISRGTFSERLALPQNGAMPSLPPGTLFYTGTSVRYPILQCITR